MKKIAYLVAPLMVMPFLIGCNKVKTHKVASVLTVESKLKFTTMKGKDLKGTAFNHKQKLKFKVESVNEPGYTVDPYGIGVYVGKNAVLPLLEGIEVEITNDARTEATVTVAADKVTDDIYIDSIAGKAENYIYSVPAMYGVRMPKGQPTLGWQPKGDDLELEFEPLEGEGYPDAKDFLYTDDAENFHYDGEEGTWMDKIKFTPMGQGGQNRAKVTVYKNTIETGYLMIAARSGSKGSFLDAFNWDEIAYIADNHLAPYFFNLGDQKKIKLNADGLGEVEHIVKIIGFDHDTLADSTEKACITFQFATAISDSKGEAITMVWDATDKTSVNFENASINKTLKSAVLPLLPAELTNHIKTVTKSVGKRASNKWEATPYTTQLFPLADIEVAENPMDYYYDDIDYVEGEGKTYAYYVTTQTGTLAGKRQVNDANGNGVATWLRSPNPNYDYWTGEYKEANYFTSSGYLVNGATVSDNAFAVAPAFCI